MRKIGTLIIVALLVVLTFFLYRFIHYREVYAVSDAAFVRTDSLLTLGFKVGGKVVSLEKKEGDRVKKGEVLAHIDPKDFNLSLQSLLQKMEALKKDRLALLVQKEIKERLLNQKIILTSHEIEALSSQIAAKKHILQAKNIALMQLGRDYRRYKQLFKKKLIQKEKLEHIQSRYESQKELLRALQKQIEAMEFQKKAAIVKKKMLSIQKEGLQALVKKAQGIAKEIAALKQQAKSLRLKIAYCTLTSPIDGVVAKRYIALDRVVKRGSPIYSIVNPKDLHIEVLLSEKKLAGVKVGNSVKISVDAFKDRHYRGRVQKILPASAATFALVPRDIASGEFTKLDQRFVVRITIDNPTLDLRVGMGASVAIKRD